MLPLLQSHPHVHIIHALFVYTIEVVQYENCSETSIALLYMYHRIVHLTVS